MQIGETYYVRIDTRTGDGKPTPQDLQDHLAYLREAANGREFLGGGFVNAPGGLCVFAAKDQAEAEAFAKNDPFIARGFFTCAIHAWKLTISS